MTERSPGMVIFLSIITCGIYGLYWTCVVTNEIEQELKRKDGACASGGMTVLFSILTCGIYMYYWWYKQGQRTAQLMFENNVAVTDNASLYLVLCIFGLSIVNMALMQSSLNKVVYARRNPPMPPMNGGSGYHNNGYNNNGYSNGGYGNNSGYNNGYSNGGYGNNNGYDNGGYGQNGQYPPDNGNNGYNNNSNNNNNNNDNNNNQWL